MDIMSLIISLLGGAVGGNIGGALLKNLSLGTLGNSIAGILGGGIGSWLLGALGVMGKAAPAAASATAGLDIGSLLGNVASGGVGGIVLMAIIGFIRSAMGKSGN